MDVNVTGLVNFLLTGLCINYDVIQIAKNTSIIKRETLQFEYPEDPTPASNVIPEDVCILAQGNNHALAGHHFKIATWEDWPASFTTRDENNRIVGQGTAFEFVEVLQEKFGFTYEVVVPEDGELGDKNRGLLGMLHHKKVDFVAAFLPMTSSLLSMASPSIVLGETEFVILMNRPAASATGSGLLAPFTMTVWFLILISLLLVGPIIFLIIHLRNRLLCPKKLPPDTEPLPGEPVYEVYPLSSCVWFVYGALLKQGSTINAKCDSSRMLFATWWLFILVLTAYYTANLTAFLTLSKFTLPIDDAKGIKKAGYRWFAEKGRLLQNSVLNESSMDYLRPEMRLFGRHFVRINGTSDWEKILEEVNKGSVYLGEKRTVEYLIFKQYLDRTRMNISENLRCTLAMTPKSFLAQTLAFFYPLNSTLKKLFDPTLLLLTEAGIVKHKQREYLPLNQICPLNLGNSERRLQNGDLFTTYMVIAAGFAAGATAFIAEHAYRRWTLRRARKRMTSDKVFGGEVPESSRARKRVRLRIPLQPRYTGIENTVILPPGPTKKPPSYDSSVKMPSVEHVKNYKNGHANDKSYRNGHGLMNGDYRNSHTHANGIENGNGPIHLNGRDYGNGHANDMDIRNAHLNEADYRNGHRHVNGRDYKVLRSSGGTTQLVPMRTPSAFLFR